MRHGRGAASVVAARSADRNGFMAVFQTTKKAGRCPAGLSLKKQSLLSGRRRGRRGAAGRLLVMGLLVGLVGMLRRAGRRGCRSVGRVGRGLGESRQGDTSEEQGESGSSKSLHCQVFLDYPRLGRHGLGHGMNVGDQTGLWLKHD
jgi:hypothetical protein